MAEHHESSRPDAPEDHVAIETHEGDQPQTEVPDEADIERIEQAPLAEEVALLKDALLRTRAEMDNLHKRGERELEKSRKFAVEGLLKDLVPVIDTLDQGLENASGDAEGLSLTRKLLVDTLTRHGLEILDPLGEPFDPQWHEAMSLQPSSAHEPDTVMVVLQRGYRLHERLVRPARVIVSRAG